MNATARKLTFQQARPYAPRVLARAAGAIDVARENAAAVDRDGRFPHEAFDALRAAQLLGAGVPVELGGLGAGLAEIAQLCAALGEVCSSTALIYAMHNVKIACLARHHRGEAPILGLLAEIAGRQWLVASSTTEGVRGGDIRNSEAAIQRNGPRIALERRATVISYAEHADALVTTARRAEDSAPSDQVLLALRKCDYTLTPLNGWDTFGMRGTCSKGFNLVADADAGQVMGEDYSVIHSETMTPAAHLLWGAVWLGIASEAYRRARDFTRAAARGAGGAMPPGAVKLTQARLSLDALRSIIGKYALAIGSAEPGAAFSAADVTLLKVQASELAVDTVTTAMRVTGLAGYRNDGAFSCGRLLRDVLSAPLMINNERILAAAQAGLAMSEAPAAADFLL